MRALLALRECVTGGAGIVDPRDLVARKDDVDVAEWACASRAGDVIIAGVYNGRAIVRGVAPNFRGALGHFVRRSAHAG